MRGSAMASATVPSSVEADLRPRQRDHGGGEVFHRLLAGQRADSLVRARRSRAAAGQVDVGRSELAVDVARRDAESQQPVGIERDADLALSAADTPVDLRRRLHALQRADDGIVDEPGQLLGASCRARATA